MSNMVFLNAAETEVMEQNQNSLVTLDFSKSENTIDDLFFADVKKVKAKSLMPGFDFCSNNDHLVLVQTKSGNKIIVNNCSKDYLLVSNNSIFPQLEEELKKFGDFEISRTVENFSNFSVDYTFRDSQIPNSFFVKNEVLFPRVRISNSYNSKSKYHLTFGLFRMICENGLALPKFSTQTSFSHCQGNLKQIVETSVEGIAAFLENVKSYTAPFEILFEKKIAPNEIEYFVNRVLTHTNSLLSYKEDIVERILKENKTEKVELNLWNLYNGINYFLQPNNNPKITASADSRSKMDQRILDYIFALAS